VDERTRATQQLRGRFHCWWKRRSGRRAIDHGVYLVNLRALFMKLTCGQVGEAAASVCHQRELHAEREMAERLELVVPRWYDLLALLAAVAEERRVVADQDNHRDAVAELPQKLLDEPRVGLMEADVDCGKRFVTRQEVPCRGELALRIWVRQ